MLTLRMSRGRGRVLHCARCASFCARGGVHEGRTFNLRPFCTPVSRRRVDPFGNLSSTCALDALTGNVKHG